MKNLLLPSILICALPAWGATIYQNTTTDTGLTAVYSALGVSEIGDRILLTAGNSSEISVQFYNLTNSIGTFDILLRVLDAGLTELGTFSASGMPAFAASITTVSFSTFGLPVPNEVIIMVSISNQSAGIDLGLNLFDPPTIGSSLNTELWVNDGTVHSVATGIGEGNLYLQVDVDAVPEPSTLALMVTGTLVMLGLRRRRRSTGAEPGR